MLTLAQVGSGVYQLLLILHLVSVVVAFSPAIVHAVTGTRLLKQDEGGGRSFFRVAAANERMVYLPALTVVGLLGFALVGMSDGAIKFGDPWVSASALLWLIIAGVVSAVIMPAERLLGEGDRSVESKVALGGAIVSVLFVIVVFLMVVKPG
jgi:uncharacterized membrane protein